VVRHRLEGNFGRGEQDFREVLDVEKFIFVGKNEVE
jgi:hypothetical protein